MFSFIVALLYRLIAELRETGGWQRVVKDPITDTGKKSLSGLVRCREAEDGTLEVYDSLIEGSFGAFTQTPGWQLWFLDGYRVCRQSFDDVRARARA